MDVRNRMADVVKLRCNACQDFLRMILSEGWQKELYKKAKYEVTNNTRFKDKYIATYEQMRNAENGVDNYSVDDLDVTLMTELVVARFMGISVDKATRSALIELKDNRNITNHSSENEENDELYLRGLLALCNLRDFVRTVDKKETDIDDEKRLAYRQKYIPKIEELKELLDEERIELVQKEKSMRKDIQRVLDSDDPYVMWGEISKLYFDRYSMVERNDQGFHDFIVCASDAGVEFPNSEAADYFAFVVKDPTEAERRLWMLYNSENNTYGGYASQILDTINWYIKLGGVITDGMKELIKTLTESGFNIEKSDDGLYELAK